MIKYTTIHGDTFDIIALDMYDDEFKAHHIMQANPKHVGVVQFQAGVVLNIPEVEEDAPATLPPWKR